MELKFSNDTNFIKFWPLPAEILSATHHHPIHPGNYIPDISVSLGFYPDSEFTHCLVRMRIFEWMRENIQMNGKCLNEIYPAYFRISYPRHK